MKKNPSHFVIRHKIIFSKINIFICLIVILFGLIGQACLGMPVKKKSFTVSTHHALKSLHKKTNHTHLTKKIIPSKNTTYSHLPAYVLSSIEKRLVEFVQHTIMSLRYGFYKLGGTTINTKRGIFIVDCSSYVDHVVKSVYPRSYSTLVTWSRSQKPTSDDYYQYFTSLPENKLPFWNTIESIDKLRPGDILVFRYKNIRGHETGGHVMIVMDKPMRTKGAFLVRVADSATAGHSKDTRRSHHSGIGMGTLLLKTNGKTTQPDAYAWKIGTHWQSNVSFAMARPMGIS